MESAAKQPGGIYLKLTPNCTSKDGAPKSAFPIKISRVPMRRNEFEAFLLLDLPFMSKGECGTLPLHWIGSEHGSEPGAVM